MAGKLKKEKQKVYLSPGNLKRKMIPRIFFMSYLGINVIALTGIRFMRQISLQQQKMQCRQYIQMWPVLLL